MPTFTQATPEMRDMLRAILSEYESHQPLLDMEVKIDLLAAHADLDEHGEPQGYAMVTKGVRALGQTRVIGLKDRVAGRGDAEIVIDGDWWGKATGPQQRALLDHEVYHISLKMDKSGSPVRDDSGRPKLTLREHDADFGWFAQIAARHGNNSIERIQARELMDNFGQFFWGDIVGYDQPAAKPVKARKAQPAREVAA